MTAARPLIELGGGSSAIQAGGNEVGVELREGRERRVSQARDENISVLVLTDRQVLCAWRKQVQHLEGNSL